MLIARGLASFTKYTVVNSCDWHSGFCQAGRAWSPASLAGDLPESGVCQAGAAAGLASSPPRPMSGYVCLKFLFHLFQCANSISRLPSSHVRTCACTARQAAERCVRNDWCSCKVALTGFCLTVAFRKGLLLLAWVKRVAITSHAWSAVASTGWADRAPR